MCRTPEDIQDELLVLQCQEGDQEALKALIARWQPRFGRLAWRLTREREAARDVVQDTWLAIVRGLRRLDDPARFRAWAYRIVTHKCADWTRRRVARRSVENELRGAAVSTVGRQANDENCESDVAMLRGALAGLPDDQRAILSLHYLDGMGVREIARVLDVPQGTVKSRMHHARIRLKQALERVKS